MINPGVSGQTADFIGAKIVTSTGVDIPNETCLDKNQST